MPPFIEKFVFPCLVAGAGFVIYQAKWDWQQKISLFFAIALLAFFLGHTFTKDLRPAVTKGAQVFTDPPLSTTAKAGSNSSSQISTPHPLSNDRQAPDVEAAKPHDKKVVRNDENEARHRNETQAETQNAPNGINIGRDNFGTAVVNNYGPPPISLTGEQLKAITLAVQSFAGFRVKIGWEHNPNTNSVARNLAQALEASGLVVEQAPAMIVGLPDGSRPTSGIVFTWGDKNEALALAIAKALKTSGYPAPANGFRGIPLPGGADWGNQVGIYMGGTQ